MPNHKSDQSVADPEVRQFSDRLMVILGDALMEEIEKAESDGANVAALQFGALDALTKQLSGALSACVAMVRQLALSQKDFIALRQRVHEQLEPAVLALMNRELGRAGSQGGPTHPSEDRKVGHA